MDGYKIWMENMAQVYIKDPSRVVMIGPRPHLDMYTEEEKKRLLKVGSILLPSIKIPWYKKIVNYIILIYEKVKKHYRSNTHRENSSSHVLHKCRRSKDVQQYSRNDGFQRRYKKD